MSEIIGGRDNFDSTKNGESKKEETKGETKGGIKKTTSLALAGIFAANGVVSSANAGVNVRDIQVEDFMDSYSKRLEYVMGGEKSTKIVDNLLNSLKIQGIKLSDKALKELETHIKIASKTDNYINSVYDIQGVDIRDRVVIEVIKFHGNLELVVSELSLDGVKGKKLFIEDLNGEKNIRSVKTEEQKFEKMETKDGDLIIKFNANGGHYDRDSGYGPGRNGSSGNRFSVDSTLTKEFGPNFAVLGGIKVGNEQFAALIGSGIDFKKYGRIFVVGSTYFDKYKAEVYGKDVEKWVNQFKINGEYCVDITDSIKGRIGGSYSESENKHLATDTYDAPPEKYLVSEEDENFYYIYEVTIIKTYRKNMNLIGGIQEQGYVQLEKGFGNHTLAGRVKLTNREYNDGEEIGTDWGVGGSYKYSPDENSYEVSADVDNYSKKIGVGYSKKLKNGSLGISPFYEKRDGENNFGGNVSYSGTFNIGGEKGIEKQVKHKTNYPKQSLGQELSVFGNKVIPNSLDITPKQKEEITLINTSTYKVLISVTPKKKPVEETETKNFDNLKKENFETIKKGETYNLPNFADIIECRLIEGGENISKNANGGYDGIKVGTFKFEIKNPEKNEVKYITVTIKESDETAPILGEDNLETEKNTPLKINQNELLKNDTDNTKLTGKFRNVVGASVSMSDDGIITITPNTDYTGNITFEYQGVDNEGNKAWGKVTVKIVETEAQLPPKLLKNISDKKANAGETLVISFKGCFEKTNNDSITYSSPSSGVIIDQGNKTITIKSVGVGNKTYEIIATDNDGKTKLSFNVEGIDTTPEPDPDNIETVGTPTISNITQTTATITNNITDLDGVRNIKYFLNGSLVSSNLSGLTPSTNYNVKIEAEVYDRYNDVWKEVSANKSFRTKDIVNTVPTTPTISGLSDITLGQSINPSCSSNDADSDSLTYKYYIDGVEVSLPYTPTTAGTKTFKVVVSDGKESSSSQKSFEVKNNAPVGEDKIVDAGGASSFSTTVNISDPDGHSVSIKKVGEGVLGGDLVISSASASGNTISVSVSEGVGWFFVDYKVVDENGKESDKVYRVILDDLDGE